MLIQHAREQTKYKALVETLAAKGAVLYGGVIPDSKWSAEIHGAYSEKVFLVPNLSQKVITDSEDFTVLGGWCVMRTKCIELLNNGRYTDLLSGEEIVISDIQKFADWLANAISVDQIAEAIGVSKSKNYVAVSEIELWSSKISTLLSEHLKKALTEVEKKLIYEAVTESERKRSVATKRYLSLMRNEETELISVHDLAIVDDLESEKAEMYEYLDITQEDLLEIMMRSRVENKSLTEEEIEAKRELYKSFLVSNTNIQMMYTGKYLDVLKKHDFVHTKYGIIIEPWYYPSTNEAEAYLFHKLITDREGRDNYFVEGGMNEHVGYFATTGITDFGWNRVRRHKKISEIPNVMNYNNYYDQILSANVDNFDLSTNSIFLDAYNFDLNTNTQSLMYKAIHIIEKLRSEKARIKVELRGENRVIRDTIAQYKESIKQEFSETITELAEANQKTLNSIFSDF